MGVRVGELAFSSGSGLEREVRMSGGKAVDATAQLCVSTRHGAAECRLLDQLVENAASWSQLHQLVLGGLHGEFSGALAAIQSFFKPNIIFSVSLHVTSS